MEQDRQGNGKGLYYDGVTTFVLSSGGGYCHLRGQLYVELAILKHEQIKLKSNKVLSKNFVSKNFITIFALCSCIVKSKSISHEQPVYIWKSS